MSIHVLRVEDDTFPLLLLRQQIQISIHVLRVEDDPTRRALMGSTKPFQSTSSVWRTTTAL